MLGLNLLKGQWDVVIGVAVAVALAPTVRGYVAQVVQGVAGQYAGAATNAALAIIGLMILGNIKPGLAVGWAAVFLADTAFALFPKLKTLGA